MAQMNVNLCKLSRISIGTITIENGKLALTGGIEGHLHRVEETLLNTPLTSTSNAKLACQLLPQSSTRGSQSLL